MERKTHTIHFGRDICGDLPSAERREWLVTNGLGGFASGTIAGTLTRRYHGILLAALNPPLERTLLVSKLDETAVYAGKSYSLYANNWVDSSGEGGGYRHIERFYLDGTTPVWEFAVADALLEKRIWMAPGENTTYVRYRVLRGAKPLSLSIKALVNDRSIHDETEAWEWKMKVDRVPGGIRVLSRADSTPFYVLSDRAKASPFHQWIYGFHLLVETHRGLKDLDDHLHAGTFEIEMKVGESVLIAASTEAHPELDDEKALSSRVTYERNLFAKLPTVLGNDPRIRQLALAADQFMVQRAVSGMPDGRTIIAGYHWFGDWGRDTMIALPGLTLATGRPQVAAKILKTFAQYVDQGMLPNHFPSEGETPEYNTVDAALWFFEAVRAYHEATRDKAFVRELFPALNQIVNHYRAGTRYGIRVDPEDGLVFAGEKLQQLTWMDAKVGDWVVTPRHGKPVEISALWYNALRIMETIAPLADVEPSGFAVQAEKTRKGFEKFWNADAGALYDVLDTPDGKDARVRPNQLMAVSLPYSPLAPEQQKAIVDICAEHLLTSHGMRSLAPNDPDFIGTYGGRPLKRDGAYHQGTVWGWLIGPFVAAHLRVYRDPEMARSFLEPLLDQLMDHGVGNLSEIFDGNPPFTPRGTIAQAWTVAEVLRAWRMTFSPDSQSKEPTG